MVVALFSETHLKPHMGFYFSNYDTYWTDHHDEHKGRSAAEGEKDIPHMYIDLPPFLSVDARVVCILIRHTEILLAPLCKSPQSMA
jgi:hypothetical protein